MLIVRFTRVSPTHHRFEIERADGSKEATVVETRSLLVHDLLHLAFETEACLAQSFYGLLASTHTLADLVPKASSDGAIFPSSAAQVPGRVVGPLTGVVQGKISARALLSAIRELQDAHGEPVPAYLTEGLIERTAARFHRLHGQWKATPFGQTMELRFESADTE